ncbi:glycosyltransferase [Clostridium perfringens]|uniref:Glycosyltransferase n=1 Tax=Clostridium perfringens TaxID=1502 RepID=A0AAW9ISE1_CLOPF|nr:glycosyltransferase [Clostridium perfringens]EJT6498972.1 glycosyltransferase [Clostridium perfringens]EJT6500045.1 glycosyltransferase [Clostridium perfringens]MDZ5032850.1 glycosyltransferase [Clostridium perfringens]
MYIKELISIVVPVYNCKEYLNRCVDSLLNQSYRSVEIILIDDGSNDGSELICDYYKNKDNRVKVFHLKNGGVSRARNFGIKEAKGEYITFVDSDDWVDENIYKIMYEVLKNNNSDLVCCDYYLSYNSKIKKNIHENISCNLDKNKSFMYLIKSNFYCGYVWNKIYKHDILDKLEDNQSIFDNTILICEDLLLNCRYLELVNNITYIQQPLYYYYQNINSVSNNREFNNKSLSIKYAYEKILDIYKNTSPKNYDFVFYEYIKVMLNLNFKIKYSKQNINLNFNRKEYIMFIIKSKKINKFKKVYLIISVLLPYSTSFLKEKIYKYLRSN